MARMLKKTKRLGRCNVHGHGCNCEVAEEIQSVEWTRTKDKRQWKSELQDELDELEENEESS